jgi:vacuolar protein sorting-associated protein 18
MDILKTCDMLKIEDILPFFPDFTYINDFKDEICLALEDYNRRIEQLRREMDEARKSADLIRLDIGNLRNRCAIVDEEQKCDQCSYPLLSRPFYVFPCQHGFHSDCLRDQV